MTKKQAKNNLGLQYFNGTDMVSFNEFYGVPTNEELICSIDRFCDLLKESKWTDPNPNIEAELYRTYQEIANLLTTEQASLLSALWNDAYHGSQNISNLSVKETKNYTTLVSSVSIN